MKPRINILTAVRRLTRAGKSQKEIAAGLHIHRNSVYRYQRKLGLHARRTLPVEQQKKILELLRGGMGTSKIGKFLGVGEHQARLVAAKYKFRRKVGEPGYRYHLSPEVHATIVADILQRRDYAAALARKYGIGHKFILKLAKEILKCERLTPGRPLQPLESPLPQMWPKPFSQGENMQSTPDQFVQLADAILKNCFHGRFPFAPAHDREFAKSVFEGLQLVIPDFKGHDQQTLRRIQNGLTAAFRCLRQQDAQWQN